MLYVANASGLAAVRTGNGTLLWRYAIPNAEAVVVVNGVAYLYITASPNDTGGCGAGVCTDQVVAVNATTGARLWQKSLPDGQLLAEPVAND